MDEQDKLIARNELWRESITLGSMSSSWEDITQQINLGHATSVGSNGGQISEL